MKRLYDISWQVDELTYRADKALSYSTLARYAKEGFNKLDHLFDKIETPSLTFGSAVDALVTGGREEFDNNFIVVDFPTTADSVIKAVKAAFTKYSNTYHSIDDIPSDNLLGIIEECAYQPNWKPETRVRILKEKGKEFYDALYAAGDKQILDNNTYIQVLAAVDALKTSPATKELFADNNPFEPDVYREYQLKFKATLSGVDYRCMADLLYVDYKNKIVYPIDLKTSSHTEWDFFESFVQWMYHIQSRLYWRIIRDNMNRDEFFKDFELADYTFVVVNKNTLTPLKWEFKDTKKYGPLIYGKNKQIEFIDPFELGKELSYYLKYNPKVPRGINIESNNDIIQWLNGKA